MFFNTKTKVFSWRELLNVLILFVQRRGRRLVIQRQKYISQKMYQSPWRVILAGEVVFKSLKIWGSI
jgi:hypothetical protein